jgi:hypothetical protein
VARESPNLDPVKSAMAVALLLCGLLAPWPARAAGQAIDLSAGTLGLSAALVQPIGPATDLRVAYGDFEFTRTQNFSNLVIDVIANLSVRESYRVRTFGIYADHLVGRGFHVSGGLIYNLNRIGGVSVPTDSSVVIGGTTFSQKDAGQIFTVVRWPALAPYLGVGFVSTSNRRKGIVLFGEAGAYYEGRARVEFSATGAIAANVLKFQPYFDEGRRQLTTELAPVAVYPVVQVGLRIPL